MPCTECNNCGGDYHWHWEEAFEKFGFCDGDSEVMTYEVEAVLQAEGYEIESSHGIHNRYIESIKRAGKEIIPESTNIGYDDPRDYLPNEIVELLDRELPSTSERY